MREAIKEIIEGLLDALTYLVLTMLGVIRDRRYGEFGTAWLCHETSGNLAPVFGSVTLTAEEPS